MTKLKTSWYSQRVQRDVTVTRWGEIGTPVLFFPTAAADAEECERFHVLDAIDSLIAEGRVKLYSVDSVGGQAMVMEDHSPLEAARIQNQFDAFVYHELVPAIRADCRSPEIEIVVTGPSIGAFNSLAAICRHPDVFSKALCMSGTYDVERFLDGRVNGELYYASPSHFLPNLGEGEQLARLRQRFVLLAHGEGRWEDPAQSWRVAEVLGKKGVPNRVDSWGKDWDHDWPLWRAMLPKYLPELVSG
jgi:esterase/lipase superfamily enzyme